jgi:hypothetical protein
LNLAQVYGSPTPVGDRLQPQAATSVALFHGQLPKYSFLEKNEIE